MGIPFTTTDGLPEYENPPVVEVVCGVLFKTLDAFSLPHFGLFWERCKANYPTCRDVAPLLPLVERLGDQEETTTLSYQEGLLLPRVWFINADNTGIIQLQRDRFLHNWKKGKPTESYPRYHTVIEMFRRQLQLFEEFLKDQNLGAVQPIQYEMTYVNHIAVGESSLGRSDPGRIFRDFQRRAEKRFLPGIEHLQLKNSFELPNREGRLHASIQDTKRYDLSDPIYLFELTVRGLPSDSSREGMWKWFEMSREWIVRGFADLTTEEAQKTLWGRTR